MLRKQSCGLFLARSREVGTEIRQNLGHRARWMQGVAEADIRPLLFLFHKKVEADALHPPEISLYLNIHGTMWASSPTYIFLPLLIFVWC